MAYQIEVLDGIEILVGEIGPEWTVVKPLTLTITREGGDWLVGDEVFSMYGEGNSRDEARQDYITTLIEYYDLTAQSAATGDKFDQVHFERVKSYLQKTEAVL